MYSLRQLVWMADQKREEQWGHTSWVTAHIVNAGMNIKRPVQPNDVNPYAKSKARKRLAGKTGFREMKGMLF